MITITVLQLIQAEPVLNALMSEARSGSAKFVIRRLASKVAPELALINEAKRSLITEENSDVIDEAAGTRRVRQEYLQAFLLDPLFSKSIELSDASPLTPADLADSLITPRDLDLLGPLFTDK